jgi:hypothetical protein
VWSQRLNGNDRHARSFFEPTLFSVRENHLPKDLLTKYIQITELLPPDELQIFYSAILQLGGPSVASVPLSSPSSSSDYSNDSDQLGNNTNAIHESNGARVFRDKHSKDSANDEDYLHSLPTPVGAHRPLLATSASIANLESSSLVEMWMPEDAATAQEKADASPPRGRGKPRTTEQTGHGGTKQKEIHRRKSSIWSAEESSFLVELVELYEARGWSRIANELNSKFKSGKTNAQCSALWFSLFVRLLAQDLRPNTDISLVLLIFHDSHAQKTNTGTGLPTHPFATINGLLQRTRSCCH